MVNATRKKLVKAPIPADEKMQTSSVTISWYLNGKGGVGKSTACLAEIDTCLRAGHDVVVIETDLTNMDVGLVYRDKSFQGKEVKVIAQEMDSREGFVKALRLSEESYGSGEKVIINGRAGNSEQLRKYSAYIKGLTLNDSRPIRARWVANPYRDSVGLLNELMTLTPTLHVDVLKPLAWGEDKHYRVFNESATRKILAERGGVALMFPVFHPDQLFGFYVDRFTLEQQYEQGDLYTQIGIDEVRKDFDEFFERLNSSARDDE